jgi:hypothetical protein
MNTIAIWEVEVGRSQSKRMRTYERLLKTKKKRKKSWA